MNPSEALGAFFPEAHGAIKTVALIDVALEEVQEGEARHPGCPDVGRAFLSLRPRPGLFDGMHPGLVRAHMRELVERAAAGEDLRPGTGAECIMALARASLVAPMVSRMANTYVVLFVGVFGEEETERVLGASAIEWARSDRHEHETREVIAELRDRMTDGDRGLRST